MEGDEQRGVFDRFAAKTSTWVARAPFFMACLILVVLWLPSYFLLGDLDTWQLIINTATTIITFLLVALLQNSSERFEKSMNTKTNAMVEAIADLLEDVAGDGHGESIRRLREAAGLEERVEA